MAGLGNKDFIGTISIADLRAVYTATSLINAKSQLQVSYTGYASPSLSVNIIGYDYSTDDGVTWTQMTTSSTITGLAFTASGLSTTFVWDVKDDLGLEFYNTLLRMRFKYQSGAYVTDWSYAYALFERTQTSPTVLAPVGLPDDYKGIPGTELLIMLPKNQ